MPSNQTYNAWIMPGAPFVGACLVPSDTVPIEYVCFLKTARVFRAVPYFMFRVSKGSPPGATHSQCCPSPGIRSTPGETPLFVEPTYIYIYIYIYIYMYRYMHTPICIYMYIHIYIYIHTYTHIYIHTFIHSFIHTYIHTHIYIYIRIIMYMYVCMYIYIYIYTHTYIYIHIYIYIYTYVFFHARASSEST